MVRRVLSTCFVSALLSAALVVPASAAEPGFTVSDHDIPVVDGPNNDQNIVVDASLYVPDGVSAANPAPVVINAHGFNGSKNTNDAGMNQVLAKAGYVVFAYSSRGFGATNGKIGLNSVDYDVKDVRQLIDWLAARPEVQLDAAGDPRLGMVGPSYGGGIQLQVAGVDDRVDVIVPFITWHSLVSSLSPNYLNTDPRLQEGRPIGVFKQEWTSLFYASGNAQPLSSPAGSEPPGDCPNFVSPLCRLYTETLALGRATPETVEILKSGSPATPPRLGNIDIPTLLIQGQADTLFTLNEAVANYTAIRANGAPVKMIWQDGGHGYPMAEGELAYLQQRALAWFNRHLRGDTSVDTGPAFEYYRRWAEGGVTARYGSAGAYPVGRPVALFPSSDGALAAGASQAQTGAVSFVSNPALTSYSETSNFQNNEPFRSIPPTDPPGTFAAFTTPPLKQATTVVGIPTVEGFTLSSTVGEAQLFAKIYDIAPDGSQQLIRRLVAPIRATDLDGTLSAQLAGFAHRFPADHQIRLVLASTDKAYGNLRTPTAYALGVKAGTTKLTLPVVGAAGFMTQSAIGNGSASGGGGGKAGAGAGASGAGSGAGAGSSRGATAGTFAAAGTSGALPATGGGALPTLLGIGLLGGAALMTRRRRS